jgi:hypothetical protein
MAIRPQNLMSHLIAVCRDELCSSVDNKSTNGVDITIHQILRDAEGGVPYTNVGFIHVTLVCICGKSRALALQITFNLELNFDSTKLEYASIVIILILSYNITIVRKP